MIATFSVGATGTAALNYQWTKNGASIPGGKRSGLSPRPHCPCRTTAPLLVTVSNPYGNQNSANATLTVNAAVAPAITTQPANATVTEGASASFTATASEARRPPGNGAGTAATFPVRPSSNYTTPATVAAADNGAVYSVVATNMAAAPPAPELP